MKTCTTTRTIDAYDNNAQAYADKFDNYEVYSKKISDFQHKHIQSNSRVVDLGCGPGTNINALWEMDKSCSFTGIDLSASFIKLAQQRFPAFCFQQQDLRNLELETPFDVIIASFCIVHLTNAETIALFKKASNLLTKGGVMYLSYMNGELSGFETTSFSQDEIFFNYYQDEFIVEQLKRQKIEILEIGKEKYVETDGTITIDTFIYARQG